MKDHVADTGGRADDPYPSILLIETDRASLAKMNDTGPEVRAIGPGLESDRATVGLNLADWPVARVCLVIHFHQREPTRSRLPVEKITGICRCSCGEAGTWTAVNVTTVAKIRPENPMHSPFSIRCGM